MFIMGKKQGKGEDFWEKRIKCITYNRITHSEKSGWRITRATIGLPPKKKVSQGLWKEFFLIKKLYLKNSCIFAESFLNAESPWVITGGRDTYIQRRFLNALGLTSWESRKLKLLVKTKATGTPLSGVHCIHQWWWLYNYTSAWGFQRCSVGQAGQYESFQDVDRAQNWLHVPFCVC